MRVCYLLRILGYFYLRNDNAVLLLGNELIYPAEYGIGLGGYKSLSYSERVYLCSLSYYISYNVLIERVGYYDLAVFKAGVIKQFIGEVRWGDLDYLVVDCPPGTGDEPLSVCQLVPEAEAILVTTPQQVATLDVSKSISFCNQLGMRVAGVIENMSGFTCPHCGTFTPIFRTGGGEALAKRYALPFLGKLPIATEIGESGDEGRPFVAAHPDSPAAKAFMAVVDNLLSIG